MKFGCQACPAPSLTAMQTYTGLQAQNRGCAIKSWTKYVKYWRYLNLNAAAVRRGCLHAGSRSLLHHELSPCQFRETAALRHQFIERSAFDHMSVVEHQDARGIANGREPVRDHEGGASLHHLVERGVNLGFGDGVERAGRLVEDQDRRILQQRARDRQPLPLAAGRHAAPPA